MDQQGNAPGDVAPTRRAVVGAAAAGAAGAAVLGVTATGPVAHARPRTPAAGGVRAVQPRLHVPFDHSAARNAAVPLTLRSTRDEPVTATVTGTTGRTSLLLTEDGADQGGSVRVTVRPDQPVSLFVLPRGFGEPGEPGDRLRVRVGRSTFSVEVWIEPTGGMWRSGPGDGQDLGIVAVHAALLRTPRGPEVLMWSPPRLTGEDGDPLADPERAGQWQWYKFQLNATESRVLNLRSGATRAVELPAFTPTPADGEEPARPRRDNIFCAGAAHLPDGRVLSVGGHLTPDRAAHNNGGVTDNARHLYVFDPAGEDGWTKLPGVLDPSRWYPTVTQLPDGRMLVTSGTQQVLRGDAHDHTAQGYWHQINNDYLVIDPVTRRVHAPKAALVDAAELGTTSQGRPETLATYPGVFVLPKPGVSGAVVAVTETNRGWLFDYEGSAHQPLRRADRMYPMRTPGSRSYPTYGSMVLLPFDAAGSRMRVLAVGGQGGPRPDHRALDADAPSTNSAEVFDVDTAAPLTGQAGWRAPLGEVKDMSRRRNNCDATLLADGSVLVSGGSMAGWGDHNHGSAEQADLFDPDTESFRPAARAATDRRYHSTALLLPDGTLLKAGSTGGFGNVNASEVSDPARRTERDRNGRPWMTVHTTAERFYPPYLWRGPRPVLHALRGAGAGDVLRYGRTFTLEVSGGALGESTRVALVRLGCTTHGNDMDQRYVRLKTTVPKGAAARRTLTVTMPGNPAAAPPGDYQLLVVDGLGVPSEGRLLRVGV